MKRQYMIMFVFMFIAQACGLPSAETSEPAAVATNAPVNADATATPETEIIHQVIPDVGSVKMGFANDSNETEIFEQRIAKAGEDFSINRFERPYTASLMAYVPYVDIKSFRITQDDTFYYIQIVLAGVDPTTNGASGQYGVELDLNVDGRADILILASNPASIEWSTDNVIVYLDENGDVGGATVKPDEIYTGNGFETEIFNSGSGSSPDLAWARFVNYKEPIVEIAFQRGDVEEQAEFMLSALASGSAVDPKKFYYNDTITLERAGSSVKNEYYPLKELAVFDNTCRVPVGFTATGKEPMGCDTQSVKEFSDPLSPVACIPAIVINGIPYSCQ